MSMSRGVLRRLPACLPASSVHLAFEHVDVDHLLFGRSKNNTASLRLANTTDNSTFASLYVRLRFPA